MRCMKEKGSRAPGLSPRAPRSHRQPRRRQHRSAAAGEAARPGRSVSGRRCGQGDGDVLRLRERDQPRYGFWLPPTRSPRGGSAGYDHKAMGITARGAWESVKRHFREMGVDTQTTDFTVAGGSATCRATCSATACCSRAHPAPRGLRCTAAHLPRIPTRTPRRRFANASACSAAALVVAPTTDAKLLSAGGGIHARSAKCDHAVTPAGSRRRSRSSADALTPTEARQRDSEGARRPSLQRRDRHGT